MMKKLMKYDFNLIEPKWQKKWREERVFEPDLDKAKKPFYNLMMFPYPSAEGLHVGNMYAFTGSDIYGRFKRMQGYDVFEPIGLDGFGIHSENYAIRAGKHPRETTKDAGENFYRQLQEIGNGFAWDEKLETYDPAYYKWTQWIFVQMFKHGLAYRKKQPVNWCPSCKTVLADEQVVSGECERCLTKVEKRELEQWFFKITDYADRLLSDLEKLDWSERVKIAQRNWIGKSNGALIKFPLRGVLGEPDGKHFVEVFTTRPDTIFGATYLVLSPEHPLIDAITTKEHKPAVAKYKKAVASKSDLERTAMEKEKTGVFTGAYAINPVNNEKIPVWIADYVLMSYGTGAIMAVPAHDERDFEFAKKHELPVKIVICPHYPETTCPILDTAYTGKGHLVDSGTFNGMPSDEAAKKIVDFVKGRPMAQYHLRDWLISRQRYWGPPIPMIYCETCASAGKGERKDMPGWYAVPDKDLPVELPFVTDFRPKGTGQSPLAAIKEFYEVKCPACGKTARRETDVSDTFLDSALYYLRYLDPKNVKEPWSKSRVRHWLPIGMYIGGAEHAVLHLLYFRFLAKVFHDWKLIDFEEPARCFRAHGLLIRGGKKISKSKGNIVNPDEFVKKYGADALRMHLMFLGPFEEGGDFADAGIMGPVRFLERVWKLIQGSVKSTAILTEDLKRFLHKTIKKVTDDIETLNYNTAVSALMTLLNEAEKEGSLSRNFSETFLKLLAPFAPHITEELWSELGHKTSIHKEEWPKYDPEKMIEKTFTLVIQVNGRVRDTMEAPLEIKEDEARRLALSQKRIREILQRKEIKKVIFVPKKLINFVVP